MAEREVRLEEAFERIEETILPCIAMMLDTLMDASEIRRRERAPLPRRRSEDPRRRAQELPRIEESSPSNVEPGEYKTRGAAAELPRSARAARGRYPLPTR